MCVYKYIYVFHITEICIWMYVFDKLFLSKASLQSTVFIQNLYFTKGPRLGCMGTGRFWQMWYPFISQVDFFYHFICIRSTLISFIIIFPLKSIPQQGSVVPPSAPQDYCGSNDTSRFSITGTIEWFKPFLVLAWASGAEYGLQCRPNSCRDDCITRCFPKGRVQCSQDRFLLKRWLCLSDSFSLFWSTFSVVAYPPVIFLFSYILK